MRSGATNIYRLLTTLIACGYVAQMGRFRYVLSSAHATALNTPVDEVARQLSAVLKQVSERTEDIAFEIVREGTQSHCIAARHIGTFPVRTVGRDILPGDVIQMLD